MFSRPIVSRTATQYCRVWVSRNLGSTLAPPVEHLDELLEADHVAHADRRVHRDEVVEVVLGLGRLQVKDGGTDLIGKV